MTLQKCRMAQASVEKLERTGPAEKERVASVPKRKWLASMPEPPLSKGKKRAVSPEYQIMRGKRVKVGKSHILARKREIREGA